MATRRDVLAWSALTVCTSVLLAGCPAGEVEEGEGGEEGGEEDD